MPSAYCRFFSAQLFGILLAYRIQSVFAGSVWPKPLNQTASRHVLFIDPREFSFVAEGQDSGILQEAFDRYTDLIFDTPVYQTSDVSAAGRVQAARDRIKRLDVYVASNDQSLNLHTPESYSLTIAAPRSSIEAATVYGALHALETFSQLIDRIELKSLPALDKAAHQHSRALQALTDGFPSSNDLAALPETISSVLRKAWSSHLLQRPQWLEQQQADADVNLSDDENDYASDGAELEDWEDEAVYDQSVDRHAARHKHHNHNHKHHRHKKGHHHKHHHKAASMWVVNATSVWDNPRFQHRGLLLDTARHFLPMDTLKDMLDAMAWNKLNVFHWHIVDDQSFPFVSERLPLLSLYGAYSPAHVYTPDDVRDIVAYARARGIRVVPEFDTPGHTLSWGKGYPELLTDCYNAQGEPTGEKGPLNPARNGTYGALWTLLREVAASFPDAYVHLGGDEVPFDCWQSNPEIRRWMQSSGVADYAALEQDFERRVLALAAAAGRSYIVWQDVIDNGVQVSMIENFEGDVCRFGTVRRTAWGTVHLSWSGLQSGFLQLLPDLHWQFCSSAQDSPLHNFAQAALSRNTHFPTQSHSAPESAALRACPFCQSPNI